MTNVLDPVQSTVATPYWANVRLPVVAEPANVIVTLVPCVMVWDEPELLNITMF